MPDSCAPDVRCRFGFVCLVGVRKAREMQERRAFMMAGELGFDPRLTESESAVLPLNYSPSSC